MLLVFPLSGAYLLQLGLRGLLATWSRRPFLRSAVGTVIRVEVRNALNSYDQSYSQPSHSYFPVLRFTTEAGETRVFLSATGKLGNTSPYSFGMTLPVLYDLEDIIPPTLDNWADIWLGHLLTFLGGPIFLGGAALVYYAFGSRLFE